MAVLFIIPDFPNPNIRSFFLLPLSIMYYSLPTKKHEMQKNY